MLFNQSRRASNTSSVSVTGNAGAAVSLTQAVLAAISGVIEKTNLVIIFHLNPFMSLNL